MWTETSLKTLLHMSSAGFAAPAAAIVRIPSTPSRTAGASSGGIVTQEAAIHVSNVMVIDSDGKPTRIGYRVDEESGKKIRVSKRNGKDI